MCGIVGKYFFREETPRIHDLTAMMKAIYHRGPDESGTFCEGRVALGFQRLSIIDTVSGGQPLYNETKTVVVMANGEIYNFRELRHSLESKGHTFRTHSDCEVIAHLYEEYGEAFVPKLNGMFAIVVYDTVKEQLLIARDRMGIKPFYFYQDEKVFIFGSEIKGILASDEVSPRLESSVIDEYLIFRSLANSRTFFSGVKVMKPGTCFVLSPQGSRTLTHWSPQLEVSEGSTSQIVGRISDVLRTSVERQMVSDVPLGTLLSGGVDSSWVSALAGMKNERLKTFTVGFEEDEYDETPYAQLLARTFNLDYHERKIGNKEFADTLPLAIWYHDEPLNHANSVMIYLICKYARQHVKVLLTGEGADELFGGYPRYYICKIAERFLKLGAPVQNVASLVLQSFSSHKIRKLRENLGRTPDELVLWNAAFAKSQTIAWLLDKDKPDIESRVEVLRSNWNADLSTMDNLLLFERIAYLQGILIRQDKMSMAASIESRVPILDNAMIELADTIASDAKIKRLKPKYLFKAAATRTIPSEIVYKKKVGFGVPIGSWLRDSDGMGRYTDLLLDTSDRIPGLNRARLETIVNEHRTGEANHEDVLWPLVNFAIWQDKYFQ
jgi:asparagine synthase (glutamine-hydrolysing)